MAHDILVVDDEADIRALMCGITERPEGYETRGAGNGEGAGGDPLAPTERW